MNKLEQLMQVKNQKLGSDGLNAVDRRIRFMKLLDENEVPYDIGIRYRRTEPFYDSPTLLRLGIRVTTDCTVSSLFSPNCVVGGYIETMAHLPLALLEQHPELDVGDECSIAKWSSTDELLQYILNIKRLSG